MSRYIDAEPLLKEVDSLERLARKRVYDTPTNSPAYERYATQYTERERMLCIIKAQPTADVVEVRHGAWEVCSDEYEICADEFVCSYCKESFVSSELTDEEFLRMMKFCPNCGAKMDGERRENGT